MRSALCDEGVVIAPTTPRLVALIKRRTPITRRTVTGYAVTALFGETVRDEYRVMATPRAMSMKPRPGVSESPA